jgi:DeoR family transcriptional regulator, fructose operon transcriptional repressor
MVQLNSPVVHVCQTIFIENDAICTFSVDFTPICGTIRLLSNVQRGADRIMSLLAEERRFRISEILGRERSVTASELIRMLGVTAATIRRDLAVLEKEGVLVRSHGGAVSRTSSTNFQPSYEALGRSNRAEKQAIAREAERLILDGETVFLEGSTTVYELARRLLHRNRLTVITNSPPIVEQFQHSQHVSVISTGGELQKDVFYLSGVWAQRALSEIRVDKAVLGVSAIDPAYGISTASQAEAQIKKMILKAARVSIALADHSKFGNQGFAYVGPTTDIDVLVTDSATDPQYLGPIREAGVELILADVREQPPESNGNEPAKPRTRSSTTKH